MSENNVSTRSANGSENASTEDISEEFLHLIDELNIALEQYQVPNKVKTVYNPTLYAREPFEKYVKRYCNTTKDIIYVGINPGPFGMSQTGVPFGEIKSVRDWMGITGTVGKPDNEITERPVDGFKCKKTEISGKRLWGLFKTLCGTPENFFKTSFAYNYLPQQWMDSKGGNLTPGDFKKIEVKDLFSICDKTFSKVLELYQVKKIVALGKFCENRANATIQKYLPSSSIEVMYFPHPSPLNRVAPWPKGGLEALSKHNLLQYYVNEGVEVPESI